MSLTDSIKRKAKSTRRLIDAQSIEDASFRTFGNNHLTYFIVEPVNVAVLSPASLQAKINSLMTLIKGLDAIELVCCSGREDFQGNKQNLKNRLADESCEAVRELLEQDLQFLEDIQTQAASAREFLLCLRFQRIDSIAPAVSRMEKLLKEQGFRARVAGRDDLKRLFAVYFSQGGVQESPEETQHFLDLHTPAAIRFYPDHYICGSTYRSVWAVREYPTETSEQALLRHLGEKSGVTLRVFSRHVTPGEERKIISNASSRNRMKQQNPNDLRQAVVAEQNVQDIAAVIANQHRNREPLIHCSVYIETMAVTLERLRDVQADLLAELNRAKLGVDRLYLRQKEGFTAVQPCGHNALGAQFERVLPAGSVANLYPFNYSGKTDPGGFSLGRDKYGSHIITDFTRRAEDKTNANILILGNSGEGKSHLLKLILTNIRESGQRVVALDPDGELRALTEALGGCYLDLMTGEYIINVLQPKLWDASEGEKSTALSQHISFLRDFFRSYKDFSDAQIDTLEILCGQLYEGFCIDDTTDLAALSPEDFPILSDLYALCESAFKSFDDTPNQLYTRDTLRELCLGLHSLAIGAESKFFNGHTNITGDHFLAFGVKGIADDGVSGNLKNALLFNILSFMSDALLRQGNTALSVDELHIFLQNPLAIGYLRSFMKRVRKKNSAVILASQNLSDFLLPGIAELTKPLFAIPTHSFLFYPGSIEPRPFMEMLQLEDSEYELIRYPQRGVCLFRCGNERYNLKVIAPEYKASLFGNAGGV